MGCIWSTRGPRLRWSVLYQVLRSGVRVGVGVEAGIETSAAELKSWWVYMVQTKGGRLYTGITTDPKRRFKEHCDGGRLGARFFRTDPAFAMVFQESQPDRSAASKREAAMKKLTRQKKLELVEAYAAKSGND